MLDEIQLELYIEPLLDWFFTNARVLPWRSEPTPYRVWVSEIMLQQTRVEAVKPYFARFIKALPDVRALAECPEDKLFKLWEGLGYYNRARNMQTAAKEMIERHDGVLPADYNSLLKLKGIGHYTAGAVASIAYGLPEPAVDGNVLRVLTRVAADDTDIMKQPFRLRVENMLRELLKYITASGELKRRMQEKFKGKISDSLDIGFNRRMMSAANMPGSINQAWMELGAIVCLPNGEPLCGECPWQNVCKAKAQNKTDAFPVKSKAKARKIEQRTVFVIQEGNRVALSRRPGQGLLAGLYELPNTEGKLNADQALTWIREKNMVPLHIKPLSETKHIFSHIEWHMSGFAVRIEERGFSKEPGDIGENLLFVEAEDARETYAIPSAFAAYAKYFNMELQRRP